MLTKNKVEIEKPYNKTTLRELDELYRQKPNRKFLMVFRSRPYFYMKGLKGKQESWYRIFLRDKLGEQPVLLDSSYISLTIKRMDNYLKGKGYYYADISFKVDTNGRKQAHVNYYVKQNQQYKFGHYSLHIADKEIYDLVKQNMKETFIVSGRSMDNEMLYKEQERIVNLLRNNGYYTISKEFVDFDVDTTTGHVAIGLNIQNQNDLQIHKKYYVNEVRIEIESSITENSLFHDSIQTRRFYYYPNGYKLKPEVIDRNIFFTQGRVFRQNNLNRSYGRLSDLGVFRFINIQPHTFERNDSGFVDYYARLIPTNKYNWTFEPQVLTSDQNNTPTNPGRSYGIAALTQFQNRNVFRHAEVLSLSYRGSLEAQGTLKSAGFFNSTEHSLTAAVTLPHALLMPFIDRRIGFISNKTSISVSGTYEQNIDYRRQVLTTSLTYTLNRRAVSYYVSPIEVSFIKSDIVSPNLEEIRDNSPFLQTLFANNLITDSRFGLIYSNKNNLKADFSTIRWDALELGGNILTLFQNIVGGEKDVNGHYKMFGINYFQYVKMAIDYRYNNFIDPNNTVVYRGFLGAAIPYGNSDIIPFEKRYFAGGVNDLRGWQPRRVGPGSYNSGNNQLDFSGELKLEANADFRFNIYNRWLEGALFADAGNVWNAQPSGERPNAHFDPNRFYKEIAIDAGTGIRLNFEILVIRFDFALPLRDPREAESDRWVIKNFNGTWLLNNTNFNFGIGYPF